MKLRRQGRIRRNRLKGRERKKGIRKGRQETIKNRNKRNNNMKVLKTWKISKQKRTFESSTRMTEKKEKTGILEDKRGQQKRNKALKKMSE